MFKEIGSLRNKGVPIVRVSPYREIKVQQEAARDIAPFDELENDLTPSSSGGESFVHDHAALRAILLGAVVGSGLTLLFSLNENYLAATSLVIGFLVGGFIGGALIYFYFKKKWQRYVQPKAPSALRKFIGDLCQRLRNKR